MMQALLFYIPRWLWKNWEAGKVRGSIIITVSDENTGFLTEQK
jgi:hypothetical protein